MSYQRETESPDERRSRQRRARLTLLVVAVAATAVIVPLVVHVRHSWATSGGVAGSGDPSGTAVRSPSAESEQGPDAVAVDPDQPWLHQLAYDAAAMADGLAARGETRTLTAPAQGARCPKDTGGMSAALGVPLAYEGDGLSDYPDRCE